MPASTAVVNTGRAIITSRLIGTATAVPLYVAWGTGSTAVSLTDTTLTEPGEAGLFTASSGGTLFVRGVLASTISVTSGDSVAFTFNVSITSAVV